MKINNKVFSSVADAVSNATSAIKIFNKSFKIYAYGNPKLIHLALHSKKARVRKKNMHRLQKEVSKNRV